ncbi:MAG: hypothetical protein ACLQU3_20920 [Limisphaerales bacterium]
MPVNPFTTDQNSFLPTLHTLNNGDIMKSRPSTGASKHMTQTPDQKSRAATLLLASDSPAAFVRACLVKKRDGELGVVDLYGHYQEWAKLNHVRPFASRPFTATAKQEIEIGLGLKLRHDLEGGSGKAKRGWKGLALVERAGVKNVEIASCQSVG